MPQRWRSATGRCWSRGCSPQWRSARPWRRLGGISCAFPALVLPVGLLPTRPGAASPPAGAPLLAPGATGKAVLDLQHRLAGLGYRLGRPDGVFGDVTEQAVDALQKADGIGTDGIVGPLTRAALARGVVPHPRPVARHVIEIDLDQQLLLIVDGRATRRWRPEPPERRQAVERGSPGPSGGPAGSSSPTGRAAEATGGPSRHHHPSPGSSGRPLGRPAR